MKGPAVCHGSHTASRRERSISEQAWTKADEAKANQAWKHSPCVSGRVVLRGVGQPGPQPSSISRGLRLGNVTQLPCTSVCSFANRISPQNCIPSDTASPLIVSRQTGDSNSIYTSWSCCEDWLRSWKQSAWHLTRSQKKTQKNKNVAA